MPEVEPALEERARAAFDADMAERGYERGWDELEEWQRESWRCEVDENRDPDLIRQAARSTRGRIR